MLKRYSKNICKLSPYILHDETYIPTENGFILIPLKSIQLDLSCEDGIVTKEIIQVTLVTESRCKAYIGDNELFLPTKTQMHKVITINNTYDIYRHALTKSVYSKVN